MPSVVPVVFSCLWLGREGRLNKQRIPTTTSQNRRRNNPSFSCSLLIYWRIGGQRGSKDFFGKLCFKERRRGERESDGPVLSVELEWLCPRIRNEGTGRPRQRQQRAEELSRQRTTNSTRLLCPHLSHPRHLLRAWSSYPSASTSVAYPPDSSHPNPPDFPPPPLPITPPRPLPRTKTL